MMDEDAMKKRKDLVIGARQCIRERQTCGKVGGSVRLMDKKEINSTKMTVNFLIWVGGVFMLLLFALLAHFVWRIF